MPRLHIGDGAHPVAIPGFGTAGAQLATLLEEDGYNVVAVSDSTRAIHNADGFDVGALRDAKADTGELPAGAGDEISPEELLELDVDVLAPAALENQITSDNADLIKARIVLEVANGPTANDADPILAERGVTVIPDILANAGGVTVSYFEWTQNKQGYYWDADTVRERLETRMVTETEAIWNLSADRDVPLRTAAYAHGLERISAAVDATGSREHYQGGRI
jgi:glutamate dehydrogenase (NADP+)